MKNFRITSRGGIAEIRVKNAPESVFVYADPLEIELVIVNLLKNASEALRETPRAAIDVALETDDSGREAVIRIADNGPRLSDEAFGKLARPFETSKTEARPRTFHLQDDCGASCRTNGIQARGRLRPRCDSAPAAH